MTEREVWTEDPLLFRLFPRLEKGIDWGLERTRNVLAAAGDPHRAFHTIHVGGTNGKGSVAALLASMLQAGGHRVGLYTSPHLRSFRERIQIDGLAAPEEALLATAAELRETIAAERPTFFEAATVLAFHHFAREGIEVAIVEVGLGGRLDATNVVDPLLSIVTNVAIDHTGHLGDSLVEIAREKGGIIKHGRPFLTGVREPEALHVLREIATRLSAPFHPFQAESAIEKSELRRSHTELTLRTRRWDRIDLRTPLLGEHQARNTALAVRALELLPEGLIPDRSALARGVAGVRWPGRVQLEVVGKRTWLFDVAHNPAGCSALVRTIRALDLPAPILMIIGISKDKDWREMLSILLGVADHALLTRPPSASRERSWDLDEVARSMDPGAAIEIIPGLSAAVRRAREHDAGGTVVVTGSHHAVGDVLGIVNRPPPTARLAPDSGGFLDSRR